MSDRTRIVSHFSCGAASAVATKIAIEENKVADKPLPLEVIYCHVHEEHSDNMRFLKDCEAWFGVPIQVLVNEKYSGSVVNVNLRERFINGRDGAPCTKLLKKGVRESHARPGDLDVFGYTAEEQDRLDRLLDGNNHMRVWAPLIDGGVDKGQALAIVQRAGIKLPVMYDMGYDHNNCIGCVKGGAWYWNKIRVDFPDRFQQQMEVEANIGHPTLRISGQGVFLKDLEPGRGRKHEEPKIECGVACEWAEGSIYAAGLL